MININAFVFLFSLVHTLKNHTFCFCLPRYQCGMDRMTTMMISPHLVYQVKLFGFIFKHETLHMCLHIMMTLYGHHNGNFSYIS